MSSRPAIQMSKYLPMVAAAFGVRLVDFERTSSGLLVGSGCGLMMAAMDRCETFRWCFDMDAAPGVQLERFLKMAAELAEPLAICGWFSNTKPDPIVRAVRGMTTQPIVYAGHLRLGVGREATSLEEFFKLAGASRAS